MFTKGQAIDFIDKVFGKGVSSNQGLNHSVVCPICKSKNANKTSFTADAYNKRKLVVRTDNFVCHCWVCGYKSRNLAHLIKSYHSEWLTEYLKQFVGQKIILADLPDNLKTPFPSVLTLPEGFVTFFQALEDRNWSPDKSPIIPSLKYLVKRFNGDEKKAYEAAVFWGLGITNKDLGLKDRIIMPSFDGTGDLNYYAARAIDQASFPKYKNPSVPREDIIFNELNIDWTQALTIVEGPFDLLKCNYNATCLLGSELTTEYLLFLRIIQHETPVILALDPDARSKALKIADSLHSYGNEIKILDIPRQYKDVGEMNRDDFIHELNNAKIYDKSYSLRDRVANMLGTK